ncbi:hypothetical protein [Blastopirellula marina]|nr:hypothetical protein [Blastopirellula marina]
MKRIISSLLFVCLVTTSVFAAERKPLKDVDLTSLSQDIQTIHQGPLEDGTNFVAIALWLPQEYWQAVMDKNAALPAANKAKLLETMEGVTMLALVQGDVTPLGRFDFYQRDEIEKKLEISVIATDGKRRNLEPMKEISGELQQVVAVFKPIMAAAMGNMGRSMEIFVFDNKNEDGSKILDSYQPGQIDIRMVRRDGSEMDSTIELPLNALYIPRKCPNGKDAHISWKLCPWTGAPLED